MHEALSSQLQIVRQLPSPKQAPCFLSSLLSHTAAPFRASLRRPPSPALGGPFSFKFKALAIRVVRLARTTATLPPGHLLPHSLLRLQATRGPARSPTTSLAMAGPRLIPGLTVKVRKRRTYSTAVRPIHIAVGIK